MQEPSHLQDSHLQVVDFSHSQALAHLQDSQEQGEQVQAFSQAQLVQGLGQEQLVEQAIS